MITKEDWTVDALKNFCIILIITKVLMFKSDAKWR